MSFSLKNISAILGNKEFWKNAGWTVLGGAGGEVLSATIQGLSKPDGQGGYNFDMSGFKGDVISGVLVGGLGLAFNKPFVAVGTIATKAMKQVYIHGNPMLVKTVGSPIPPASKEGTQYFNIGAFPNMIPAGAMNDESMALPNNTVPAGMELIAQPDGSRILVSNGASGETISDYSNSPLADYSNSPLADYSNTPLSDYGNSPFYTGYALNDDMENFAQEVANGRYIY